MPPTLVLDIETVCVPWETLDEEAKAYLLKGGRRDLERSGAADQSDEAAEARARECMALWPLTGQIVAIGMLNVETDRGRVYYSAPQAERSHEENADFIATNERGLLQAFWNDLKHYPRVVTFNGRGFDLPYLMLRSAVHRVRPSRDLTSRKSDHVDLMDELTFRGAVRRFNLDFYCRMLGVASPKRFGVSGADVGKLYEAGRYKEIAAYCLHDVQSTAALFRVWRDVLSFEEE